MYYKVRYHSVDTKYTKIGRQIDMLCILVYNKIEMQSQEKDHSRLSQSLKSFKMVSRHLCC